LFAANARRSRRKDAKSRIFAKKLRSQKRKKLQFLSHSLARDILFIIIEEKRFSVIFSAIFCAESDMLYTFFAHFILFPLVEIFSEKIGAF
jgi:hypothetical protein